jgi:type II secretion system protein J
MEVLLAVAIFAVVLAAVQGVFFGALQLRNKTSAAIEQSLPLQHTLHIIRRDLAHMILPGGAFAGELISDTLSTATNQGFAPTSLPMISSTPEFGTAVGVPDEAAPWGDVQRVFYFIAPSTNRSGETDLYRAVRRNLLPVLTEEPERQWLMSGVADLRMLFFDGLAWREDWDSTTSTGALPQGVRIELGLDPTTTDRTTPELVELVMPLLVQASTNTTATFTGNPE